MLRYALLLLLAGCAARAPFPSTIQHEESHMRGMDCDPHQAPPVICGSTRSQLP